MKTLLFSFYTLIFTCFTAFSQEAPIQHSQLPAEAKAFLKEHFKSEFHHAIKDVDDRVITYDVFLNDDTEIEFEEGGRWKEVDGKGKPIPTTYIQKQTMDYIKIHHPKEKVVKIERSPSEYKVTLTNGIALKFNAMGVFVKLD